MNFAEPAKIILASKAQTVISGDVAVLGAITGGNVGLVATVVSASGAAEHTV